MTTPANQPDAVRCSAVLTHAHGVDRCRLAPRHEGRRHETFCAVCVENDEDAALVWAEGGENWTRRDLG